MMNFASSSGNTNEAIAALVAADPDTVRDVIHAFNDRGPARVVEHALASVADHGSGARLAYLWMLLRDDSRIEPDRMLLVATSSTAKGGHHARSDPARH